MENAFREQHYFLLPVLFEHFTLNFNIIFLHYSVDKTANIFTVFCLKCLTNLILSYFYLWNEKYSVMLSVSAGLDMCT